MTLIGGGSGGVAELIIYFLLITYLIYYSILISFYRIFEYSLVFSRAFPTVGYLVAIATKSVYRLNSDNPDSLVHFYAYRAIAQGSGYKLAFTTGFYRVALFVDFKE